MNGASKERLLAKGGFVPDGLPRDFWSSMEPPLDPEVEDVVLRASHAEKEPPIIRNSGYVVRTIEAALWAFGRSTGFEEGCLLVANLGDDSDTVAAVYGQVLVYRPWLHAAKRLWRMYNAPKSIFLPPSSLPSPHVARTDLRGRSTIFVQEGYNGVG